MLERFSAGDSTGVTKYIQFPALGINTPTTVFNTKEEFINFVDSYNNIVRAIWSSPALRNVFINEDVSFFFW